MATPEDSSMTPTQAANFRALRRTIFGAAVVVLAFLLWRSSVPGGEVSNALQGSSLSKLSGTGRASVLALSVLAGLGFAWLASTNLAKILARQVK
jgi:hypothetical protein